MNRDPTARQLTIDGREEPLPEPEPELITRDPDAQPLFDFPTTMRGQTALNTNGGSDAKP